MWAVDRLHPGGRGHRLIARRFHALLETAGHPLGPAPDAEPHNPPPGRLAEFGWLATATARVVPRSDMARIWAGHTGPNRPAV